MEFLSWSVYSFEVPGPGLGLGVGPGDSMLSAQGDQAFFGPLFGTVSMIDRIATSTMNTLNISAMIAA